MCLIHAKVIQNEVGTAPIMWFEKDNKVLVSMPGVPFEMKHMMKKDIMPRLLQKFADKMNLQYRTFIVIDIIESLLGHAIRFV